MDAFEVLGAHGFDERERPDPRLDEAVCETGGEQRFSPTRRGGGGDRHAPPSRVRAGRYTRRTPSDQTAPIAIQPATKYGKRLNGWSGTGHTLRYRT